MWVKDGVAVGVVSEGRQKGAGATPVNGVGATEAVLATMVVVGCVNQDGTTHHGIVHSMRILPQGNQIRTWER
jgi:hypothetical protein